MTHRYDSFGIEYNRACKILHIVGLKIFSGKFPEENMKPTISKAKKLRSM